MEYYSSDPECDGEETGDNKAAHENLPRMAGEKTDDGTQCGRNRGMEINEEVKISDGMDEVLIENTNDSSLHCKSIDYHSTCNEEATSESSNNAQHKQNNPLITCGKSISQKDKSTFKARETFPLSTNSILSRENFSKTSKPVTKVVLARLALVKLFLVLILTLGFSVVLLVASHLTHSLTLRIEAYHALYNLLALSGCLITMKLCQGSQSLKNTFGWARTEILSCLCALLFIASTCFSVSLESLQTAAHAGHQDPMHHPLPVIALGGVGLCLNALVFFLIGGYTHHQGCFLERRGTDVWIQKSVPQEAVQAGMRTMSSFPLRDMAITPLPRSYQGIRGILRDISGLVLVILCATVVYLDEGRSLALYVDPCFAVSSAFILLFLSVPYGKECCQILLQTIPGNINVESLSAKLLREFPEVVNIHHVHIWSLTPGKVVATAHVVYSSPKVYWRSYQTLENFFLERAITKVTLQPEFLNISHEVSKTQFGNSDECLLRCKNSLCKDKECCQVEDQSEHRCNISESAVNISIDLRHHKVDPCKERSKSLEMGICSDHYGTSAFRRPKAVPSKNPPEKSLPPNQNANSQLEVKDTTVVGTLTQENIGTNVS